MLIAASGHSDDIDSLSAFAEIREQCEAVLKGRSPQAGLVFAGIDFEHQELLDAITEAWPGIELIGGTSDAEISSHSGFREDSVSLLLLASDTIDFSVGLGRNLSKDPLTACSQAVEQARAKSELEPRLCILVPESLTISGQKTVEVLRQVLGDEVDLFGGRAADNRKYENTLQFCGRDVVSDSVPILILSGPLVYSFGVASGWNPIGTPGTITRSQGNVVYEIDGAPAVEFYRHFLGKEFQLSTEIALLILNDADEPEYLRPPSGDVDVETGAITYLSDVPDGVKAQIAIADRSAILKGCEESVRKALEGFSEGKDPEAALVVSCSSRKLLLGTKTVEEYHILDQRIGHELAFAGFYSFGEIGPLKSGARTPNIHHYTFTILLLGT